MRSTDNFQRVLTIEKAIRRVPPSGWVCVSQVTRTKNGLDLTFLVTEGKGGTSLSNFVVECLRIREIEIRDFDGGGLRVYGSRHPGVRRFGQQATLRWVSSGHESEIQALYRVHQSKAVDWVPFDLLAQFRSQNAEKRNLRGPVFLLQAYAKVLRTLGADPQIKLRGKAKQPRLKILHFGDSYLIAERFTARVYDVAGE